MCVNEKWPQYVVEGSALESPDDANFLFLKQRSIVISDCGCVVAIGYEQTQVSSVINAGNVAIFEKVVEDNTITWRLKQRITEAPEPHQQANFGASLSLSANSKYLIVGAPFSVDSINQAYVYEKK